MCKWMTEGDVEGFKKRAIVNYQYMKAMTLMSVSVCVCGGRSIRDLTSGHLVDPFTVYYNGISGRRFS